eukprot:gene1145-15927_t
MAWQQLLLGTFLIADGDLMEWMDPQIDAVVQRPTKVKSPVITAEYPWESTMHMYGSAVTVNTTDHRIYYACNVDGHHSPNKINNGGGDGVSSCCIATSRDGGITFVKPMLPHFPYQNWSHTNIVFTTGGGWVDSVLALPAGTPLPGFGTGSSNVSSSSHGDDTSNTTLHTNGGVAPPTPSPSAPRFVMALDDSTTNPSNFRSLQLAISEDGFAFEVLSPPPQLPASFADTSVSLTFDPKTAMFTAFGREDGAPNAHPSETCGAASPSYNMQSVRAVRRAFSPANATSGGGGSMPTLLNFTISEELPFSFDKLDVQMPWAQQHRLSPPPQGWESAYLAFPSAYLHYGEEVNNGLVEVRYIDGDRKAFIPRGFGAGQSLASQGLQPSLFNQPDDGVAARWDSGLTYMYKGVVDHPEDGTHSMYYFGQQGSHAQQSGDARGLFGIGRVEIVRDRWVGLGADVPTATPATNGSAASLRMTSKPVKLPTCANASDVLRLTLNAEVSVGGNISVALLDAGSGAAVQGFGLDDSIPISGNRLAASVGFRRSGGAGGAGTVISNDLRPAARAAEGNILKLDFRLRPPARIFAWQFRCGEV